MLYQPESTPDSEQRPINRMPRRELLQKLGAATAVLVFRCASTNTGLKNEEIRDGLKHFYGELDDPNGYLKYLTDREFVIKNEIFDAYLKTAGEQHPWLNDYCAGLYLDRNSLNTIEKIVKFRKKLIELGLSHDEIIFYESLFRSSDVIILRESTLKEDYFLKMLSHERFHRMLRQLSGEEYEIMEQAAKGMMRKNSELGIRFVSDEAVSQLYENAISLQWEDFYTYLAAGELENSVLGLLKSDYPEAYEIFNGIKKSISIK